METQVFATAAWKGIRHLPPTDPAGQGPDRRPDPAGRRARGRGPVRPAGQGLRPGRGRHLPAGPRRTGRPASGTSWPGACGPWSARRCATATSAWARPWSSGTTPCTCSRCSWRWRHAGAAPGSHPASLRPGRHRGRGRPRPRPPGRGRGTLRQALAWPGRPRPAPGRRGRAAPGLAARPGPGRAPGRVHLVLVGRGDRVHAAAPLVGAGLLLYAELASWAREAHPQGPRRTPAAGRQGDRGRGQHPGRPRPGGAGAAGRGRPHRRAAWPAWPSGWSAPPPSWPWWRWWPAHLDPRPARLRPSGGPVGAVAGRAATRRAPVGAGQARLGLVLEVREALAEPGQRPAWPTGTRPTARPGRAG
jgi:hypothetical protein